MRRYFNAQSRHYQIFSTLEAGLVLTGAETKAIKTRGIQLGEATVQFKDGGFYLVNAVIAPYRFATDRSFDTRRERKLLLKDNEIAFFLSRRRERLTIVPLACYTKRGWIKLQIGLAKTKKKVEKKRELIQKEIEKKISRMGV